MADFNPFMADQTSYVNAIRESLSQRVRHTVLTRGEFDERVPGLHLSYVERPHDEPNCFYVLSVAIVLKGRKRLHIGNQIYEYGAGSMIVTSVDMPTSYELIDVSHASPFVSLSLKLNPAILAELLTEESQNNYRPQAFSINEATQELLEDFERLLRILERPEQIETRLPMIVRDIHYLALSGTGGECLRSLYAPGAAGQRVKKAITWLRENFREAVSLDQLASVTGMSSSSLLRHFKALTSLTPLQYQKRLRLYEAQQFLLRGDGDVNSAAYAVGYMSPQQFNRDYKRLFGVPPGKNTKFRREQLINQIKP